MDTKGRFEPVTDLPHATRLLIAGELDRVDTNVWMGGADSRMGEPVTLERLQRSWVLDCAGRMPPGYRERAARWESQVFADVEQDPVQLTVLHDIAQQWAQALREDNDAPEHVYLMCQYGMNRSGLAAGLLLRALGVSTEETVLRITSWRPGSLSNQRFRRLLAEAPVRR